MADQHQQWLALREPQDASSRNVELATKFAKLLSIDSRLIDLGCGTGANYRFLHPLFTSQPDWLCVDHDNALLQKASLRTRNPKVTFEELDLSREWSLLPQGPKVAVTCSAFLDLTSREWLSEFANHFAESPMLLAMTFSGKYAWEPEDSDDEAIRLELLNYQQSDHGFGTSVGPDAADCLSEYLQEANCKVTLNNSDWQLCTAQYPLLSMMVGGIARRIRAISATIDIDAWEHTRTRQLDEHQLRLVVGHVDLLSVPQNSQ